MKFITFAALLTGPLFSLATAAAEEPEVITNAHRDASSKIADRQDELSADVQQLVIEQTVPKVIELLEEVEVIMDEATDQLAVANTGGLTIAAQTEIIEKIHAAAKEKQKQPGSGQSSGAMMDMMERMMGQSPDGDKKGEGKGDKPGESAGKGPQGESDVDVESAQGEVSGKNEIRRVPKSSGNPGRNLPEEFNKALDAFNRGVEKTLKR